MSDQPNAARMYDYYLGGQHNFAVDRRAADAVEAAWPGARAACWENRSFLRRAVRWLTARGIDQFLDLGSGIPSPGNVHEVAREVNPDARVVYVDSEPVAHSVADELLAGMRGVGVLRADLRDVDAVLGHPVVTDTLDLSRPLALLLVSVLHFVPGDPAPTIAGYRAALAPGSHLVISHATPPWQMLEGSREDMQAAYRVYQESSNPLHYRDRGEVSALFDGFAVLPPGITHVMDWRPDGPVDAETRGRIGFVAGVGRRP